MSWLKKDPRVVFIGSDITENATLKTFKKELPKQFLMEGISEQHLIGLMVGLAMNGKIPYLNTIATFATRRCFEQICLDAGLHKQPIRVIGSGGGVVYAPLGPTHQAVDDIGLMRLIPNLKVIAPCDASEMKRLMPLTLDDPDPMYIRLAKGGDDLVSRSELGFEIGRAIRMTQGEDALIVSTGVCTQRALKAAEELESKGVSTAVLHMHTVKPFDVEGFVAAATNVRCIVTIEEHSMIGGLAEATATALAEANFDQPKKFARLSLPDAFLEDYGSQDFLLEKSGVTTDQAVAVVLGLLQ